MRLPNFNFLFLVILAQLFSSGRSCTPPPTGSNQTYPRFSHGQDVAPDHATAAYTMNHISLLVNDLEASLDFYTRMLGMRVIHHIEATEWFGIVYLGYSHGGRNGTGWQPSSELHRQRSNMEGLIELVYRSNQAGKRDPSGTLSHLGFVVPDVAATQKRMKDNNVTIIRKAGELPQTFPKPLARAFGLLNLTKMENDEILKAMPRYLMVADPDGNVVEFQPQI
ncbi:Lactoylglutathione lyase [Colletotrichum gloeosporioides]|uniref:Lactoylglutathione lyase n=1 Tax=Colletotrichum gloeosporioides TaxID=474922 RepID=A0A8H4FP99_COLGL|nr:Lactoylglutathione lyase [Colletotrichum gloeosporioides]KAF3809553.1 Lactoylglutathione lyase [Colletotrichum gloeosporioides]